MKLSTPRLRIDHVLAEALEFIVRNAPMVFGLGVLLVGLPEFVFDYATIAAPTPPGDDNAATSIIIEAFRASLFHGAVAYLFWQELEGRRVDWREIATPGLPVLVPLLAAGVLMNLIIETAFYGLAIVGLGAGQPMLYLAGSLVYPFVGLTVVVAVVERPGVFAALGRAFRIARGARLQLLALFALYILFAFGADWLAEGVGLGTYYSSERPFGLVPALLTCATASTVSDVYLAAMAAAAYFEIRRLRESAPPDDPAAVFD